MAEEVVSILDEAMRNSPIFLAVSTGNVDALCRYTVEYCILL